MEAAVPSGVLDLEAPVLDDLETGVQRLCGSFVVAQAELKPDDLGPDRNRFIDHAGYGVGSPENVDHIGDFGEVSQ
jgi:hypothetical protein